MTQEPHKSNAVLIVVAIIGVVGTIIASLIGVIGNYNVEKLRQDTELTRIAFASNTIQSGATQLILPEVSATPVQAIQIGFDFTNRTPEGSAGDDAAPNHLFVHNYPFPSTGYITGVIYLNDKELFGSPEVSEPITLLILRPVADGWMVIHRFKILDDESPPTKGGITTFKLESPLPVEKGDIFAHWQLEASAGSIPLNGDKTSIDGLSSGDFGFNSEDIEEGKVISGRFTGRRDYFINVIFQPIP